MENQNVNNFQIDQLKEIVNIGASHASTALSQMIKHKVGLTVPEAYVDKVENISRYIKNVDQLVTAAVLKIYGDANGVMFFMFADESEKKLVRLMMEGMTDVENDEELENSAIQEMGNVLAGASLSAFAKFLDMNLLHSLSSVAKETTDVLINAVVAEVGRNSGEALVFQVDFIVQDAGIRTNFFFFIDPRATTKILEAVAQKYS